MELWPAFTRCVDGQLSLRRTARRLGFHPSTAFRWRHRLLSDWRRSDRTVLTGHVHLQRAWFAHSEKGRRPAGRAARRHGYRYFSHIPRALRVQVALAWQRDDATLAEVSSPGGDDPRFPARALFPRLADIEALFPEPLTPLEGLESIAAPGGVRVVRRRDFDAPLPPTVLMERSLRRWLRPFRGVATRYLPHYLQWFRSDLAEARPTLDPP
ncbi:MAG TPA: hypothetical protein VMM83_00675, partial [Longimicrobiales bacterium]|nr:hypothetical protein [Longimicrobiales bacterium]